MTGERQSLLKLEKKPMQLRKKIIYQKKTTLNIAGASVQKWVDRLIDGKRLFENKYPVEVEKRKKMTKTTRFRLHNSQRSDKATNQKKETKDTSYPSHNSTKIEQINKRYFCCNKNSKKKTKKK